MTVDSVNGLTGTVVIAPEQLAQGSHTFFPNQAAGTDITNTLNSYLTQLESLQGGILYMPTGYFIISATIKIPASVAIIGTLAEPGEKIDHQYKSRGTVFGFSGSASATQPGFQLSNGSRLEGVTVLNSALTYPTAVINTQTNTYYSSLTIAQTSTQISGFAGLAVEMCDDDCAIENLLIIGFAQAVQVTPFAMRSGYGVYVARLRIRNVFFDCTNGIHIQYISDVSRVEDCHGWPFFVGTLQYYTTDPNYGTAMQRDLQYRAGTAYRATAPVDGCSFLNCFSFSFSYGCVVDSGTNSSDGVSVSLDHTGFDAQFNPGTPSMPLIGIAQAYKTVGLATVGNSELYVDCRAVGGGAAYVYYQFEHSGANAFLSGSLLAGECVSAWMECYAGSKGGVSLVGSGTPTYGIHFYSGIDRWEIKSYDVVHVQGNTILFQLDSGVVPSALIVPKVSIDAFSAPYVTDNLQGLPRFNRNEQNGAYTFQLSDAGSVVYHNVGAASTYTIPPNSSVGFPLGTVLTIVQYPESGESITIALGSGVTLWRVSGGTGVSGGFTINSGPAYVRIIQFETNYWILEGALT